MRSASPIDDCARRPCTLGWTLLFIQSRQHKRLATIRATESSVNLKCILDMSHLHLYSQVQPRGGSSFQGMNPNGNSKAKVRARTGRYTMSDEMSNLFSATSEQYISRLGTVVARPEIYMTNTTRWLLTNTVYCILID